MRDACHMDWTWSKPTPLPRLLGLLGRDCTLTNAIISPRPHVKRLRIILFVPLTGIGHCFLIIMSHQMTSDWLPQGRISP
jgi:hypothetical protein